jgi:DNA-binding transcriptional LysR family regulator
MVILELTFPFFGINMDRLESMTILLKVVESEGFSSASRKLGIPLSTVSRKVSELEAYLKMQLLVRTTRKITLTDAGQSYVIACKKILEELDEAERSASGEYKTPRGELTITAPIVFGRYHLLPIVTEFLKVYPEIDLRLMLVDHVVNLIDYRVDLAVRIGVLPDSNLLTTRVGYIRKVTCASPDYLSQKGTPQNFKELVSHDCITHDSNLAMSPWSFFDGKENHSINVHSRLTVNTAEAAIDAAVHGLGITRVLSYQIAHLPAGSLKVILQAAEPEPLPVSLLYPNSRVLPQKLRAFIDFAAPRLKAKLAAIEL